MRGLAQVRAIPDDMEYYGRGPLLIAKFRDATLLWRRAEQIAEVLDEVQDISLLLICPEKEVSMERPCPHC